MDILILGNGFDIAHGLPTKYSNFLDYCNMQLDKPITYKPSDLYYVNIWLRHFLNSRQQITGNTWIDIEKEIYEVIKHISNSHMPFKNNHFTFSVSFNDSVFNLYNFEKYIREIPGKPDVEDGEFRRVNEHSYNAYQVYLVGLKGIVNFLYCQLRVFTKLFNNYLISEVSSNIKKTPKYDLRINSKCVSLLNFNYTDTCEQLYKINFSHNNYGVKTKTVYVHGKIDSRDNCNLVLGTQSFDNKQIPVEFNIFKKHHQRHRYGTIESYQELLNELKYPTKMYTPTFHIIGHSLDESDHNILKHILKANEKSIIKIYYHDEDALVRMQNNVDLIIGEEEVMTKVRFIAQDAPESGILIKK